MKTIKFTVLTFFTVCVLIACDNKKKKDKTSKTPKNEMIDTHTADVSIDWNGYYYGELPCASCSGIKTSIVLSNDGTYEKIEEFLGENKKSETKKGEIKWSNDKTKMTLGDVQYLIGEGKLVQLDVNGKEITGKLKENYTLKKLEERHYPNEINQELAYEYKGDDGKSYQVIFNTDVIPPTALVKTTNGEVTETLKQTEASAKTAVYKNENAILDMKGDKGTFKLKDKIVKLSIVK